MAVDGIAAVPHGRPAPARSAHDVHAHVVRPRKCEFVDAVLHVLAAHFVSRNRAGIGVNGIPGGRKLAERVVGGLRAECGMGHGQQRNEGRRRRRKYRIHFLCTPLLGSASTEPNANMLPVSAVLATPMSTSNCVCVVTYSMARARGAPA